jgi:hypothetical protein
LENDAHWAAIGRLQCVEFQPLVVPDALYEPFANRDRNVVAVGVTQNGWREDVRKTLAQ